MEDWFVFTGATKFISDKRMHDSTSMTSEACEGFHQIIKALFYESDFQAAAELINSGKEAYQDIENSILDLNSKGKFVKAEMNEKSESLERSKELYLTFGQVLNDFSANVNIQDIQDGLDHIAAIFEILDLIVTDFELNMIKQHIHSIFGWIISTNMLDKFVKILTLGNSSSEWLAKMRTLQILCHMSEGLRIFNPEEDAWALIPDEGYYKILYQKLNDAELLIRIRECLETDCLEVVETASTTIGYFVKNDLDLGKTLEEYGVISALIKIIGTNQADSINESALWWIFNICRKYLPDADRLLKDKEEDPIYAIMFKIGDLMYSMKMELRSCYCYMILTCGYALPHMTQYSEELKALCERTIELLQADDVTLVNWWFMSMTNSVRADSHFVSYFNNSMAIQAIQKHMLSPGDNLQVQAIMNYLNEISLESLLTFDNNIIVSLHYAYQSHTRFRKDIVIIFMNIVKAASTKLLVKYNKDLFKFVFEAVADFKSDNDELILKQYNQSMVAIDIVYLLSSLEFMHTIWWEATHDMLASHLSADKVNKLEPAVGFFYDWYQMWEMRGAGSIMNSNKTDPVLEQCANILLDVLKEIGIKTSSNQFSGFNNDYGSPNTLIGAKERLQDFVELLEDKIFKTGPIESDHQFTSDYIWVKVHDMAGNREFEMNQEVKFIEFESEIINRCKIDFPQIEYEDDRGDKIIIDSEYSFDHAIKQAVELSKRQTLDQVYFDVFLAEKPGYVFKCIRWSREFLKDSKYGNNDYCDRCESSSSYRRSTTPVIGRSHTQKYSTPAPRLRMTSTNYTRTPTHRTYTPMRGSRF